MSYKLSSVRRFSMVTSLSLILAVVLTLFTSPLVAFAGNGLIDVELRHDFQPTPGWKDYQHFVYPSSKPASGSNGFATGWFSVNLGVYNGQQYSSKFTQVGIYADPNGVTWFVYSEAGVNCTQGTLAFNNHGCLGSYGQFNTGLNRWTKVELVTYNQGFWIARVWDDQNTPHDLATIPSSSLLIYAASAQSEEAYAGSPDPHFAVGFWHWHPQYMVWGSGFQDWPASSGINNVLLVSPASVCPTYYGESPSSDPRYWFTGSGGTVCSKNPFF